jgi:hypothetical protein
MNFLSGGAVCKEKVNENLYLYFMTTIKEAKAREARVKELVKKIKPVDTSKVVLPERKTDKAEKRKGMSV